MKVSDIEWEPVGTGARSQTIYKKGSSHLYIVYKSAIRDHYWIEENSQHDDPYHWSSGPDMDLVELACVLTEFTTTYPER